MIFDSQGFVSGGVSTLPTVDKQATRQDQADLEAPSAKRLKTQFRCSKCGFITINNKEFQQHIPQHKTDENTPQCLHCGLCFTSVQSLSRHLFIVHKVKDLEGEQIGVREKELNSRPVKSAKAVEVNEFEPSQEEEPESPICTKTTDFSLKTEHSLSEKSSLYPGVRTT